MKRSSVLQKLLKIEPGVSLGWWLYERIAASSTFVAAVLGGSLMGYLATITEWLNAWGPVGWGGVSLAAFLVILVSVAIFRYVLALVAEKRAHAEAIRKWGQSTDAINPMDTEFKGRRIKIQDLRHPLSSAIENKRFIDCELHGPAIIATLDGCSIANVKLVNCDIVKVGEKGLVHNVTKFINVEMYRGQICSTTIYITETQAEIFKKMSANFIN